MLFSVLLFFYRFFVKKRCANSATNDGKSPGKENILVEVLIADVGETALNVKIKERPYYTVLSGENTGVYRDFSDCEQYVYGVKGSRIKKCNSEKEALDYLKHPEKFSQRVEVEKPVKCVYSNVNTYSYAYIDGSYSTKTNNMGMKGL